ncbi:A/G-specific adenine glycosylase [Xylanibacillus composti]|uniref:Adenine DNA glycosylase n=1 Tax=Xylanibacillus composti TaxID=1572762 RepID=A0A8J4M207_9BACL|nr:A/G-specific adenine glycosylase [Xylanibacillus composti]MDT9725846.1 A/G-specific adenine glycosylase [Xylanibacillus composti]GIQ69199.1 adenine DNA glycosylase [Xylanibacillus composti]
MKKQDDTVEQSKREYFAGRLVEWFRAHQRDLPWRRTKDPYKIWVSEIMLQQTRVETVIPYYERFMERFPTLEALAEAPEEDVLKLWEGLGYYSRARNLQAAVREVQSDYGGVVPDEPKDIAALKGVGPYTAGAILSIAYGKPEPAVDGNVMRVLSRFFLLRDDIAKPATRKHMERLLRTVIPQEAAGDFNQALMELGATICTPRSPHCLVCPVMEHCAGRLAGEEETLPLKTKAKPPRDERRLAALIRGRGEQAGRILIRRRPDTGLLAQMWELPHVLAPADLQPAVGDANASAAGWALCAALEEEGLPELAPSGIVTQADHIFSHIHWHMEVYLCSMAVIEGAALPDSYRWVTPDELEQLALPKIFHKLLSCQAFRSVLEPN